MGNAAKHKKKQKPQLNFNENQNKKQNCDTKKFPIETTVSTVSKHRSLTTIFKSSHSNSSNNSTVSNDLFTYLQRTTLLSQLEKEEISLKINVFNIVQEGKGLLNSKYQIMTKLAHGATGSVFIAKNNITQQTVAVKLTEKEQKLIVDNLQIKNEIILLKNLNHPHILRQVEFYESPTAFYMISELCKYGELYDRIKRGFSERELSMILYQIFTALDYCHDNNIVHRDLKLENVLVNDIEKVYDDINKKEIECFWIKLIDFGTAKLFMRNRNERTIIGTSYYIAPEVLKKNYNEKCDTWSVGVILFILLTGKAPFDGKADNEIMHKIKNGIIDEHNPKLINASKECQDLIKRLLEVKIEKRLSAKEALAHDWFIKNKTLEILSEISNDKAMKYIDNLLKYNVQSKLYQLIIAFLTHNVMEIEEMSNVLRMMRIFDSTSEDRVNYRDFFNGLCKYKQISEIKDRIDELFLALDSNNDGYLEYEELLRGMIDKKILLKDEMLMLAFKFFDRNNRNVITFDSLKATFDIIKLNVSDELCRKFFNELNVNNREKEILYKDFKQYMINNTDY